MQNLWALIFVRLPLVCLHIHPDDLSVPNIFFLQLISLCAFPGVPYRDMARSKTNSHGI